MDARAAVKKNSAPEPGPPLGDFVTIAVKFAGLVHTWINTKEGDKCFWRMKLTEISDFSD